MLYSKLPASFPLSDKRISVLTLGTAQLGLKYGINNLSGKPDAEHSFSMLSEAVKGGITSLDTSGDYGTSEETIGRFIHSENYTHEFSTLATKYTVDPNGDTSAAGIEKQIRSQLESSLLRLGLKKIPLFLSHNDHDILQFKNTLITVMKRLISEGLVGAAGASVETLAAANALISDDFFQTVQIPLNMMCSHAIKSGITKSLSDSGKVVFIRSVYLQGLFFRDPDTLSDSVLSDARPYLLELKKLSEKYSLDTAQIAFSYIRDLPGVSSLLLGSETPEQVKNNIDIASGSALSDDLRNEIEVIFDNVPEKLLSPWLWFKK